SCPLYHWAYGAWGHGRGITRVLAAPDANRCAVPARGGEREGRITILLSLSLVDAGQNAPLIAFHVGDFEAKDFPDAPAGRVRRHQEGAVLGVAGAGKEPFHVVDTEHLGEALVRGPWREVQLQGGPVECFDVEEADGGGGHVAGTPGQFALLQQVVQIGA